VLKAVLIKFRGYVTTVAIEYQKPVATECTISCILVKYVLKLTCHPPKRDIRNILLEKN
jgi:hypothetical protein